MKNQCNDLPFQLPFYIDQSRPVIRILVHNSALCQYRVPMANLNQGPVIVKQLLILPFLIPEHAPSAIRIRTAVHSYFIAIINYRHARKQKLNCGCQFLFSCILTDKMKKSCRIMCINKVP